MKLFRSKKDISSMKLFVKQLNEITTMLSSSLAPCKCGDDLSRGAANNVVQFRQDHESLFFLFAPHFADHTPDPP